VRNEIRIPDVQVVVGAAGNDCAVFSFYVRPDIHQGYEVICGVGAASNRSSIRQILQDCLETLRSEDWSSVDDLYPKFDATEESAPFR